MVNLVPKTSNRIEISWEGIFLSKKFLIPIESESKEKILKELDDLIHKYNSLHLRIRENNEKIKRKLDKVTSQLSIHLISSRTKLKRRSSSKLSWMKRMED